MYVWKLYLAIVVKNNRLLIPIVKPIAGFEVLKYIF